MDFSSKVLQVRLGVLKKSKQQANERARKTQRRLESQIRVQRKLEDDAEGLEGSPPPAVRSLLLSLFPIPSSLISLSSSTKA
jgi:hypothetical protein